MTSPADTSNLPPVRPSVITARPLTIESGPTLQRQHDDAVAKGQKGRQTIFDSLLTRLDADASRQIRLTRSPA